MPSVFGRVLLSAATPAADNCLPHAPLPIISASIPSHISIEKAANGSHHKADGNDDDRCNDRDRQGLRRFQNRKRRNENEDRHDDGDNSLIRLARTDGQKDRKQQSENRRADANHVTVNYHRRENSTNILFYQSSSSALERRFISVR